MWLIAGLGNPGPKYELTRHNFGFLAIDALLHASGAAFNLRFSGLSARLDIDGQPCLLLKPQTFMNRSGSSVQQAMAYHRIAIDHVVVIHDELDLPLGAIRLKRGGGLSGHNGLKDIDRLMGPDFLRVRLGIGRPSLRGSEADFVLSPFRDEEMAEVENVLMRATSAIRALVTEGLEAAQREAHGSNVKQP